MIVLKSSIRRHLSIIITSFIIISSSLSFCYTPNVKSVAIPGPFYVRGYLHNSSSNPIPSGVTVTATNTNNSNSDTTTTLSNGAFQIDVGKDGLASDWGNQIVINCSAYSEVGENATAYLDKNDTFAWCNLSGTTKLEPENLSIGITPASWNAGTLGYGSYNSTTDSYFNLSNEGNTKISIMIQGEDISYGDDNSWNLTSTTALNNYTMGYKKSGAGSWTNINVTNDSFVTNLQFASSYFTYTYWQLFGFNFSMPTDSSPKPSGSQQFNVTFWSIKA